jgi:hypothetical protein
MRHAPVMSMGDRPGLPIYPAAMSALALPTTGPARWHAPRVTAAVLCFVTVVLVVASSFLPLYAGELDFGGFQEIDVTVTAWGADVETDMSLDPGDVPTVGYPLVFAAIALACAAAACWFAAAPGASPGTARSAGMTTAISGAFLIGTVWTTALMAVNGVDSVLILGTLGAGIETESSYLAGFWLLLIAAVLVLVAAVLSLLPARQPTWQPPPPPVSPYTETPPYGIALPSEVPPAQAPLPGQVNLLPPPENVVAGQPEQVNLVDPLTGEPLHQDPASPPGGVPVGQPLPPSPGGFVDPLTGRPPLQAWSSPLSPPAGLPTPVAPTVQPFTADPVNGTSVEPPPIVLPDPPPPPETPPGPAIPPTEDPLAEPPRI